MPKKYNVCESGSVVPVIKSYRPDNIRCNENDSAIITPLAVHGLMTAVSDLTLAESINQFQAVCPDGQPVRWA